MTAFDIYSALGNVSEELLEESELPVTRAKPKGVLYMTAAAACFAVLAVGLHFALNDSGIAAPDQGEVVTIGETHVTADVTQYTSPEEGETTRTTHAGVVSISSDGLPIDVTGPVTGVEANADDTYKYEADETTLPETGTTANMTTAASAPQLVVHRDEEDDVSDTERYSYLDYNGAVYSKTAETFDERDLTFLQNGELYGFSGDDAEEEYNEENTGYIKFSMSCAFYKIKNVNDKYMIAALTADGNYTAFKNFGYRPDTLGSYLKDVDFSNRIKLMTRISSYTLDKNGTSTFSEYELPDIQQYTEKFLAENADAVPETDIPPVLGRYLMNYKEGSGTYTAVMICDGGYISVGEAFFYIGEDKTESFMAYIEENGVEIRYDSNGEPYWDD